MRRDGGRAVVRDTYGDLKVDRLIADLSVNHCGLQERAKEEKLLNLSSSRLQKRKTCGQRKVSRFIHNFLMKGIKTKHNIRTSYKKPVGPESHVIFVVTTARSESLRGTGLPLCDLHCPQTISSEVNANTGLIMQQVG